MGFLHFRHKSQCTSAVITEKGCTVDRRTQTLGVRQGSAGGTYLHWQDSIALQWFRLSNDFANRLSISIISEIQPARLQTSGSVVPLRLGR